MLKLMQNGGGKDGLPESVWVQHVSAVSGEGFLEHKLPDVSSHTEAYENGEHKGNFVFCTFFFNSKQLQGEWLL